MVNYNVVTIPESRSVEKINEEYLSVLKEKNALVAKRFGMDELDVTLQFYDSKGALVGSLGPNQNGYGIYCGHVDGTNEIKVLHPDAAEGLLDDIPKEIRILIENALTKYYLCQKYYPNEQDFRLYYKYVSDILPKISAGNFPEKAFKFDIKLYFDGIKYKKDQSLGVCLYLMLKNSGLDFIYENLDTIMKDCKIEKSFETIYNKPMGELIKPEKEAIIEEERKLQELEKAKRAAQREAMINERKERDLKQAQQEYKKNGSEGVKRVHISSRNFQNQNRNNNSNRPNNSNTQNNANNNSNQNNNRNFNRNNKQNFNSNNKSQDNTNKANLNNPNNPNYRGNNNTQNNSDNQNNKNSSNKPNNNPQKKYFKPRVNKDN